LAHLFRKDAAGRSKLRLLWLRWQIGSKLVAPLRLAWSSSKSSGLRWRPCSWTWRERLLETI